MNYTFRVDCDDLRWHLDSLTCHVGPWQKVLLIDLFQRKHQAGYQHCGEASKVIS